MALSHTQRTKRRTQIAQDIQKNSNIQKTAKKYGVSTELVKIACKENNVNIPLSHMQRTKRRTQIAQEVKDNDGNIQKIAKKYGVSVGLVRIACEENSITIPRKSHAKTNIPLISIIAELINTIKTQTQIAKEHNVTKAWISLIHIECQKAGIPVNPRSHQPKTPQNPTQRQTTTTLKHKL